MENDFFKDFGQKWKVRNGTVVYQKFSSSFFSSFFLGGGGGSSDGFFNNSLSDSPYLMMNFP